MSRTQTNAGFTLALRRERKGWSGGYSNPQGGGGNIMSCNGASRESVIASGLRMVTPGAAYVVTQDGAEIARGTKLGACAHAPESNPRGCFYCIQGEARALTLAKAVR